MTAPQTTEDGSLPDARRKLDDAISSLIDPKPRYTETKAGTVWLDPLYDQLHDALPGEKQQRSGVPRSQAPLWVDAVDLLHEIDRAVAEWEPNWPAIPGNLTGRDAQPPTVLRLQAINARKWRPQDASEVTTIANRITAWAERITTLLADTHVKTLSAPCPACGKTTVYRKDSGGELVRQPALQITTIGCQCQACKTSWSPDLYMHLARVLGYDLPAGVLE